MAPETTEIPEPTGQIPDELPTLQQINEIIYDGRQGVSDQENFLNNLSATKKALLTEYLDLATDENYASKVKDYGFKNKEDQNNIASYLVENAGLSLNNSASKESVYEAYIKAKHDAEPAKIEGEKNEVNKQKSELAQLRPGQEIVPGKTPGSFDAATGGARQPKSSDFILEKGLVGLETFRNFLPVYEKARLLVNSNLQQYLYKDILARYDQLRGVDFSDWDGFANVCTAASLSIDEFFKLQDSQVTPLLSGWNGKGKDSVNNSWQELSGHQDAVKAKLKDVSDATFTLIVNIAKVCCDRVGWVLANSFQRWPSTPNAGEMVPGEGAMTALDLERLAKIAAGHATDEDFRHYLRMHYYSAAGFEQYNANDNKFDVDGATKEKILWWAKGILLEFCNSFNSYAFEFQEMCKRTELSINQFWDSFDKLLELDAKHAQQPGGTNGNAPQDGNKPQDAGKSAPTADKPAPSSPSSPPKKVVPTETGAAKPDSQPAPSLPPEVKPPQAEQPKPEPAPAPPPAPEPAPTEPKPTDPSEKPDLDTVIVKTGDQTITMTEPDDEGKMTVSFTNGQDDPKVFELDFGEPGEATPETTPPDDESGEAPPADGSSNTDNKIHVEDGDVKITAERPQGPEGPTLVTIEDGTGEPTTYTLGADASDVPPADAEGGDSETSSTDSSSSDDGDQDSGQGSSEDAEDTEPKSYSASTSPGDGNGSDSDISSGTDSESSQSVSSSSSGQDSGSQGPEEADQTPTTPADADTQTTVPADATPLGDTDSGLDGSQYPSSAQSGQPVELGSTDEGDAGSQGNGHPGLFSQMLSSTGSGGADQDRSIAAYRPDDELFDTRDEGGAIRAALDDTDDPSITYDR